MKAVAAMSGSGRYSPPTIRASISGISVSDWLTATGTISTSSPATALCRAARRGMSQAEAIGIGAPSRSRTVLPLDEISSAARDMMAKATPTASASLRPAGLSVTRPPSRSSRAKPKCSSRLASCWRTAPGTTPSSVAAARRLPHRASASKARSALSGGNRRRGFRFGSSFCIMRLRRHRSLVHKPYRHRLSNAAMTLMV
ncbi:hypothetical protein D3C86_1634010 [compost metagenome]